MKNQSECKTEKLKTQNHITQKHITESLTAENCKTGDLKPGKLYICATPIGNLGDMTPRVIEALQKADVIAAEDTRNSIRLLNHFGIKTPMTSYHEFNKYEKADELVGQMLSGKTVAIVTDAGTPCISDPGEVLVEKCAQAGIEITSLPGASAVITALTLSALPTRRFVFEGFLPPVKNKKEREEALLRIRQETRTIVLYEAPHHLTAALRALSEVLGEMRRISLCRELTKRYEEVERTTLGAALRQFESGAREPRGEYVLVIEGRSAEETERELTQERAERFSDLSLSAHVQSYMDQGMDKKEAMRAAAKDRGMSRRDIYQALLAEEQETADE